MKNNKFILIFLIVIALSLSKTVLSQTDIKVACIGNSITSGENTITYPDQLYYLLGKGWQVKNFGVSGRTLLKKGDFPYWKEQKFKDVFAFQPNIVTIKLGTNDSKYYNWKYKDEFLADYLALIDTLLTIPTKPEIWVCYPAKAFSGAYDIRDSVIVNGVIPFIDSVLAKRNVKLIDMYSATKDLGSYFADGIHPNSVGNYFIAREIYESLKGNAIKEINDVNLALKKDVKSETTTDGTEAFLVDGNYANEWKSTGLPSSAIIDLGSEKNVDMFQIIFSSDYAKGYQYSIEGSSNSTTWTKLVDQSTRNNVESAYSLDSIKSNKVRYIKLIINAFANSNDKEVKIAEFKALEATSYQHAPLISISRFAKSTYDISLIPNGANNTIYIYGGADNPSKMIIVKVSPNVSETISLKRTGKIGTNYYYQSIKINNGIKINSDVTEYTFNEFVPVKVKDNQVNFGIKTRYSEGNLKVETTKVYKSCIIQISDATGRIIFNRKYQNINNLTLPLGKIAKGVYIVTFKSGNDTKSNKFVVE